MGFRDVDAVAPEPILRCLQCIPSLAAGRAYKARALDLLALGPESRALDVACGLGDDVALMQARCAQAAGVDQSRTLVAEAQARHAHCGCEFQVAEATALPFAAETFDAVRIDRAPQHIPDPAQVVQEMVRVTRTGGIVLCAEPDWGTFLVGGRHSEVTERIQHDWIQRFQKPWIGRELSSSPGAAGVGARYQEGVWLSTQGFAESDLLFEIEATARHLAPELPEAQAWLEDYRQGEAYAGVLMLICWGRKG